MHPDTVTIAVVEDNSTMREGLRMMLDATPGFACVGAFADAESALRELPSSKPDVVLMDVNLPAISGIECVRRLRAQLPSTPIVMLTIEEDSARVFQSLEAGATGYLVKHTEAPEILDAIREAHRGGAPMSSQIARMVVQSFHRQRNPRRAQVDLTQREEQILALIAQGYRNKEVAEELGISALTVETHLRNVYDKLHVRSQAGAVAHYLQRRTAGG